MGENILYIMIQEVATLITAATIVGGAAWKLSQPYRKHKEENLLNTIKEVGKPFKEKLDELEDKTLDHEHRITILEHSDGSREVIYSQL